MNYRKHPIFIFLAMSSLFSTQETCYATDAINNYEILTDSSNATLISSDGSFEMGFFSPKYSSNRYVGIWYKKSAETVVWVAPPGRLLLLNATNATIWSTNSSTTAPYPNPIAQLLDSGNLVVRDANDQNPDNFIWQSFDYPTDTFLPGMKIGMSFVTGLQIYMTSWRSSGDPAAGDYVLRCDPSGYPQVAIEEGPGRVPTYKSGPWNGVRFSGLPSYQNNTIFSYNVVMNSREVYYQYELLNKSVISRFTIGEDGVGHRWNWIDRTQEWSSSLAIPGNINCDLYNGCGPYSTCNDSNTPFCGCLEKFEPKDPRGWDGGDYTNGCVRITSFDCGHGDAFLKYSGVKLPDTQFSWYNQSMSLEECEVTCFKNCNCTAYTSLNISSRNGCLLWFGDLLNMKEMSPGQDIYIRMPSSDLGKKRKILVVLMLSLAIGILMLSFWLGLFQSFHKRKERYYHLRKTGVVRLDYMSSTHLGENHNNLEIPQFDLSTISNATDNFSSNNMLGEGGYGTVYKGVLGDGQEIAVKCRSKTSLQGADEFMNEVRSIAKLQHRNLVKLLGCCIEGEERMLVYEYLSNKSLDLILFDSTRRVSLDWPKRFNIINSIARGLQYLHEDSRLRVVHRDLKASNILLDSDMNPKISDFGLARTFGGNETGDVTGRLMGTYGYIAPEYLSFGQFSVKSDVYSFGVIVLEIVCGERNRGFPYADCPSLNLLGNVWMLYREERLEELVDPGLERRHLAQMVRSIRVALLCVQEHPDERPSMSSVVGMLRNDAVLPQPTHPAVFNHRQIMITTTEQTSLPTKRTAANSVVEARGSFSSLWIRPQYYTY